MADGSEFPDSIGTVARRELGAHGITRYDQLAEMTKKEILAIHGVGPKAVRLLSEQLTERGLTFRGETTEPAAGEPEPETFRFKTTIELGGKTATGFQVPSEVVAGLGTGKRPKVSVTIGGHTYRSTVAVYGGVFMLGVSAENRAAAGVSAGDVVEVELAADRAPRTVEVPDDLAAALAARPAARAAFDALSYSNQRARVLAVEAAKSPGTRARRVAKTVSDLTS